MDADIYTDGRTALSLTNRSANGTHNQEGLAATATVIWSADP